MLGSQSEDMPLTCAPLFGMPRAEGGVPGAWLLASYRHAFIEAKVCLAGCSGTMCNA
jgi:hypothetical protein